MSGESHAVVTGGAGFLGSHLVDSLLSDGYRVTTLDNYGSGRPENLSHIESDRFASREHDVRDPLPDFERVDVVYHMASRASPDDFASHAVEIALTNSERTRNAIECALAHNATLLLASTSEVYGDPRFTLSTRSTTATSTSAGRAPPTTRASASARRSRWPTTSSTMWTSGRCASSTPTGPECGPTTDE